MASYARFFIVLALLMYCIHFAKFDPIAKKQRRLGGGTSRRRTRETHNDDDHDGEDDDDDENDDGSDDEDDDNDDETKKIAAEIPDGWTEDFQIADWSTEYMRWHIPVAEIALPLWRTKRVYACDVFIPVQHARVSLIELGLLSNVSFGQCEKYAVPVSSINGHCWMLANDGSDDYRSKMCDDNDITWKRQAKRGEVRNNDINNLFQTYGQESLSVWRFVVRAHRTKAEHIRHGPNYRPLTHIKIQIEDSTANSTQPSGRRTKGTSKNYASTRRFVEIFVLIKSANAVRLPDDSAYLQMATVFFGFVLALFCIIASLFLLDRYCQIRCWPKSPRSSPESAYGGRLTSLRTRSPAPNSGASLRAPSNRRGRYNRGAGGVAMSSSLRRHASVRSNYENKNPQTQGEKQHEINRSLHRSQSYYSPASHADNTDDVSNVMIDETAHSRSQPLKNGTFKKRFLHHTRLPPLAPHHQDREGDAAIGATSDNDDQFFDASPLAHPINDNDTHYYISEQQNPVRVV